MVECNFDKSHCFCDGFVDHYYHRAVRRSENLGVPVVMWGLNLPPPLVERAFIDVPKIGGAPPGTTGLYQRETPNQTDATPACLSETLCEILFEKESNGNRQSYHACGVSCVFDKIFRSDVICKAF